MRRFGRFVLQVSRGSFFLQRGSSSVLDDFALRGTWRNFVRSSERFRGRSGSISVDRRPQSDPRLRSSTVIEEGDDESEEESQEDVLSADSYREPEEAEKNDESSLGSSAVLEEGDDESEEEEEEEEDMLSEEDSHFTDSEDIGLSEAEARLLGTDDEKSGDNQLDTDLEETEKLLDEENDESDVQITKKKKKSYVHKLTIEDVSKILEKLRPINLKILNVQERCEWADYMVFVTGRSTRHIRGMADMIVSAVKKKSTQDNHNLFPTVEGRDSEDWMLVDCGNIIIHVFSEEARARYNLEAKWSGAEVLQIGDGEEDTGSEENDSESEGLGRRYSDSENRR